MTADLATAPEDVQVEETQAPVTVPEYNWDEVTGRTTQRLKAPKIPPCPAPIVRQAQLSYDGVKNAEGELEHIREFEFATEEMAAQFAHLMKSAAGFHTTPPTSVSVVIDPDNTGNTRLVSWKAGARRGQKSPTAATSGS